MKYNCQILNQTKAVVEVVPETENDDGKNYRYYRS